MRKRSARNVRVVQKRPSVEAVLFEDGSVRVSGPRPAGVANVGEGGSRRGGYGTVRVFGPSTVRDPFAKRRKGK